jgi:hypothetical protein
MCGVHLGEEDATQAPTAVGLLRAPRPGLDHQRHHFYHCREASGAALGLACAFAGIVCSHFWVAVDKAENTKASALVC